MTAKQSAFPPHIRTLLALVWPLIAGFLLQFLLPGSRDQALSMAPLFAAIGVVSWLIGVRWYGVADMGLRRGRPLMAGIGFSFLGWLAILLARYLFVDFDAIASGGLIRSFIYLLVFEAFCTQLWLFGVLFRGIAEWRGGLAAAVGSGLLFGVVGYLLFIEAQLSYDATWLAVPFFLMWGVFYGVIRLRTGSFLGTTIVQALQALTAWYIIIPVDSPPASELNLFYGLSIILLAILTWRLWPHGEDDYRI